MKPDAKFMVTNQLEIMPSSSMKALIALEMIRSERVGDLDTMEVAVIAEEVSQKVSQSLQYYNVKAFSFVHNYYNKAYVSDFVVDEQVLQLLKASLLSTNVLNDVFGKYCANVKRNSEYPFSRLSF